MRLTENLTSEKSADTSGPRVESLIFLPGYAQNAEHTGLMLNSKVAGRCGKVEYRPKIMIITLKDRHFVSAQKALRHMSSAANKSKLANYWNKCLHIYILFQHNMFVGKT